MREVGVLEAKTHFSALVAQAERGEDIVITRNGRAVARLSALTGSPPVRRLSGAELLARSLALREEVALAAPETEALAWEEIKAAIRR